MRLRKLEQKDAALMLEWMHDPGVVAHFRADFAAKTIVDCRTFVEAAQRTQHDLHLAIVDDDDVYMGTVSLKHITAESAEFGITLRACAMGKGFSRFAMQAIMNIARERGIKMIYWCVDPANRRAVRFYEKQHFAIINAPREARYSESDIQKYMWYGVEVD